jgi:hypothetical protein
MRKTLGQDNKKAREAAVTVLAELKGKNVKSMKNNEVTALVIALLQLLGLADDKGNIK